MSNVRKISCVEMSVAVLQFSEFVGSVLGCLLQNLLSTERMPLFSSFPLTLLFHFPFPIGGCASSGEVIDSTFEATFVGMFRHFTRLAFAYVLVFVQEAVSTHVTTANRASDTLETSTCHRRSMHQPPWHSGLPLHLTTRTESFSNLKRCFTAANKTTFVECVFFTLETLGRELVHCRHQTVIVTWRKGCTSIKSRELFVLTFLLEPMTLSHRVRFCTCQEL